MHAKNRARIALHSFGCKLNQAELQEFAVSLEARGLEVVDPHDEADAYIVNTCTVTAEADRKVRQWLRAVRRRHPESLLAACGCGVERDRAQLEPLADLLISNQEKGDTAELVAGRLTDLTRYSAGGGRQGGRPGRTRSLVKIQEGCVTPCSYCIVPFVRRGESSVPTDSVLSTVRARVAAGYREIVLTGTKPGVYRDGEIDLAGLVGRVLEHAGVERLRISSLQPTELSDELLGLWRDGRLCRHFHLSLQSGSRTVLERMRRSYGPDQFAAALERLRAAVPDVAVTTDVIVGFPGETDDEFDESVAYCEAARFSRIHVFPYSRRPGTLAAGMPGQVSATVIKRRAKIMGQVGQRSRADYASVWLGRTVQALWEEETAPGSGVYAGNTDNYLQVLCRSDVPLQNVIEDVVLERWESGSLWAWRGGK